MQQLNTSDVYQYLNAYDWGVKSNSQGSTKGQFYKYRKYFKYGLWGFQLYILILKEI